MNRGQPNQTVLLSSLWCACACLCVLQHLAVAPFCIVARGSCHRGKLSHCLPVVALDIAMGTGREREKIDFSLFWPRKQIEFTLPSHEINDACEDALQLIQCFLAFSFSKVAKLPQTHLQPSFNSFTCVAAIKTPLPCRPS